jgi:hypothetical protein
MRLPVERPSSTEKRPALLVVLPLVMALFIAILIMAYFVTRRANPIMLDERGTPIHSETAAPRN